MPRIGIALLSSVLVVGTAVAVDTATATASSAGTASLSSASAVGIARTPASKHADVVRAIESNERHQVENRREVERHSIKTLHKEKRARKRAAERRHAARVAERQAAAERASRERQREALARAAAESPQAIAAQMVAARGWSSGEFGCLDALWTRESGWDYTATNASSGAYGIPQALPGSKMATAGADWQTNPATQIQWGLDYIAGSYGTPCGAWAHSQATGFY
jgi:murein DD-endopeptidase MepM/ murein hydrolase activator NlpD